MSIDWQTWNTRQNLNPIEFWRDAVRCGILDIDVKAIAPQFEGTMHSRRLQDVKLVNFTNSSHRIFRPGTQARRKIEDPVVLSLQRSGTAHVAQGLGTGVLRPGDFCLLDASSAFEITFPQQIKRSLVVMPRYVLGTSMPAFMRGFSPCFIRKEDALAPLLKELVSNLTNHQRSMQQYSVETLLGALSTVLGMHFVDAGVTAPSATESSFEVVKRYVQLHLADSDLSAARVAAACRISVRTLHRLFAKHGDDSFEAYLVQSRLDAANDLLCSGGRAASARPPLPAASIISRISPGASPSASGIRPATR